MTSSLVGSEMCIRDRRTTVQPKRERKRRRAWMETSKLKTWGLRASRLTSVSYTHLTLPTICSV
eukprot:4700219-Prorocentrum_lima.AAC.1